MRHAYLIMAHEQPQLLQKLLESLDRPDNDFFVHIDAKSKIDPESVRLCVNKGRIFFTDRVNVVWGGFGIAKSEYVLLKKALSVGEYDYFHLLSGRDFPLKTPEEIDDFFVQHQGLEFVHFCDDAFSRDNFIKRHYIRRPFLERHGRSKNIWSYIDGILILAQKVVFKILKPKWSAEKYLVGSQFFSITQDFAEYIVDCEKKVTNEYGRDLIPDESFVQTLAYNSSFKDRLYVQERNGDIRGNMRYIDWTGGADGSPATITEAEVQKAIDSGMLFTRKVDIINHPRAVKMLEENLKKPNR